MNKSAVKIALRAVIAFLLVILALLSVFASFSSAKVNITGDEVPYNSRVSLSAVSTYNTTRKFMDITAKKTEVSSLPKSTLADIGFLAITSFDMGSVASKYSLDFLSVGNEGIIGDLTSPRSGLNETGIMSIFCVMFIVSALLVGLSGNKASFGLAVTTAAFFAIKIIRTVVSLAAYTTTSISDVDVSYFKNYDITYYDFSATPFYYIAVVLLIFVTAASAFALSLCRPEAPKAAPVQQKRPAASSAPKAAPAQQPADNGHCLTCLRGELKDGRFSITTGEEIVIGRDSDIANIVVVAPKISRKHCVIRYDRLTNSYYVTDCSTNGTFNADNGQRLTYGAETNLACGTILSLGNSDNQFRLD